MKDPQFPPIDVVGDGELYARLKTTLGDIIVVLEEKRAPNTVANFVGLATGRMAWTDPVDGKEQAGVPLYDGVRFHRVIPDFMIQCGDPLSRSLDHKRRWGTGDAGYKFSDEFHADLRHQGAGVLSMANAGPDTNGAQWFITETSTPHLDRRHSVFGKVVSGLDIVQKIARVDTTPDDKPMTDVVLERVEVFRSARKSQAEAPPAGTTRASSRGMRVAIVWAVFAALYFFGCDRPASAPGQIAPLADTAPPPSRGTCACPSVPCVQSSAPACSVSCTPPKSPVCNCAARCDPANAVIIDQNTCVCQ